MTNGELNGKIAEKMGWEGVFFLDNDPWPCGTPPEWVEWRSTPECIERYGRIDA